MKMAVFSLRSAASFRNQSALLYRAAVKRGFEAEELDISERVRYPSPGWDRLVVLVPIWPRYAYDSVGLAAPWVSRNFSLYGPVDGPFNLNLNFFKILENMGVVVPSQFCADMLAANDIKVKGIVPHGIDPKDFKFSKLEKYQRLKWLRDKYPKRTIFFSNLNPLHRKGFVHLAKALRMLSERRRKDFIFILHTGLKKALTLCPDLEKVPNLVIENAYNKLPYRQIALKTASCDVFVWPSLLEGFGLPVLEAMASARAIVCLDAAPMNELVGPDEAWLFPFSHIKEESWQGPGCRAQLHEYAPEILARTMEYAMDHPEENKAKGKAAFKRSKRYHYMKVYGPFVKG